MNVGDTVVGILALGILAYLLWALLNPEKL
ncbi:MAG TPA: potassium-transporting ATPase subunit F [Coriobacteriia bacterium]|nr:potassium-transporting ATPase subunit F [Coriobacteriia bacterium]HET6350941.1 potassium-transporting ATPase subunit F [Coriobacteriia bacterium]